MRLFLVLILLGSSVFAEKAPRVSPIEGATIVCASAADDVKVSINTQNGKIWVSRLSQSSNIADEVQGAVYQGIHSAVKFTGEVLGEIIFADSAPVYTTMIIRDVKGNPEMEFSFHEQGNSKVYGKFELKECALDNSN